MLQPDFMFGQNYSHFATYCKLWVLGTPSHIMAFGSAPYVGMPPYPPPKKNGGHIKSATLEMSAIDKSKASMSHIRHYQMLPWATGPLTSLESIAKVPDRQVKMSGWCESVVVSFPSSLVVFLGLHPYMCLFSFRKLFCNFYSNC